MRVITEHVLPLLVPHIRYWSTAKIAGQVIAKVQLKEAGVTGVYYDERGVPMMGSVQVRDEAFQDRVVAETRALLARVPSTLANMGLAVEKRIPKGNGSKKNKSQNGRQQVPRSARNDNFLWELSKRGKGNSNGLFNNCHEM